MKTRDDSELLILLNSRKAWNLPPYQRPQYDTAKVAAACRAVAAADDSDPFASQRMALHLHQGYELPSDVLKDNNKRLQARGKPGITEAAPQPFAALAPLKRRLDADRAWNQHKAAVFVENVKERRYLKTAKRNAVKAAA